MADLSIWFRALLPNCKNWVVNWKLRYAFIPPFLTFFLTAYRAWSWIARNKRITSPVRSILFELAHSFFLFFLLLVFAQIARVKEVESRQNAEAKAKISEEAAKKAEAKVIISVEAANTVEHIYFHLLIYWFCFVSLQVGALLLAPAVRPLP